MEGGVISHIMGVHLYPNDNVGPTVSLCSNYIISVHIDGKFLIAKVCTALLKGHRENKLYYYIVHTVIVIIYHDHTLTKVDKIQQKPP